jgi:phytoene dehydrogenase-like protein
MHRHLIAPLDYETEYGLPEGSVLHGEVALDQMLFMRPVPGWSRYRTPIEGLYLCGSGCHPGGGVTDLPGFNASRVILEGR